jgi:3-phosphoshikimate 1-carboxyvinyltransferase
MATGCLIVLLWPPAALLQLGVKASCTMGTGCPPVEIIAEGLPSGKVSISGSVSSQYLTALLMAAPLATGTGAGFCCLCRLS